MLPILEDFHGGIQGIKQSLRRKKSAQGRSSLQSRKILPPRCVVPAHKAHQRIECRDPLPCAPREATEKERTHLKKPCLLSQGPKKKEKDGFSLGRTQSWATHAHTHPHPHPQHYLGPSSLTTPKRNLQKRRESLVKNDAQAQLCADFHSGPSGQTSNLFNHLLHWHCKWMVGLGP